jgi:succinate dehydrogenase hydrophobic anchor subunit
VKSFYTLLKQGNKPVRSTPDKQENPSSEKCTIFMPPLVFYQILIHLVLGSNYIIKDASQQKLNKEIRRRIPDHGLKITAE